MSLVGWASVPAFNLAARDGRLTLFRITAATGRPITSTRESGPSPRYG